MSKTEAKKLEKQMTALQTEIEYLRRNGTTWGDPYLEGLNAEISRLWRLRHNEI